MSLVHCVHDDRLPVPDRHACSLSVGSPARLSQRLGKGIDALLYCGLVEGQLDIGVHHRPPLRLRSDTSLVVGPGSVLAVGSAASTKNFAPTMLALAIGVEVGPALARQQLSDASPKITDAVDASHVQVDTSPLLRASLWALTALSTHDHPHRRALLDLNATQVLLHLLQTAARPLLLRGADQSVKPSGLAAAVRHVRQHLDRPISGDELAEQACMSRSTFYRHFRAAFGVTPLQYVTRMRIAHAQQLLRDPARTVTDVSLDLGFSSVSHFIDLFRRRVGTTPRAYQQSLRASNESSSLEEV